MVSLSFQSSDLPTEQLVHPPTGDIDCAICLGVMCDPVETPCRHVFCRGCLQTCVDSKNDPDTGRVVSSGACPLCRFAFPLGFDPWVLPNHAATLERAEGENSAAVTAAAAARELERAKHVWLWVSNSCSVVRNARQAAPGGAVLPTKRRFTMSIRSCPRSDHCGGLVSRVVYRMREGSEDRVVQSVSYPFECAPRTLRVGA